MSTPQARPGTDTPATVQFDHFSIAASATTLERLGFRVTPTPGTQGRHGRVFLDGVYVEIREPPGATTSNAWFLRTGDVHRCAQQLRARGLTARGPHRYEAADGAWLDLELEVGDLGAVLPVITQRVSPAAGPWPPALTEPQPNGTCAVRELHLTTSDPYALGRVLRTLGATAGEDGFLTFERHVRVVVKRGVDGIAGVVFATDAQDDLRLDL